MAERCVCCGEIIPEGRQVCPNCEKDHIADVRKKDELKPCPFCGGEAEMRVVAENRTILRCTNSHCYMHYNFPTSWHNGDTEEHAALRLTTWWNRRADNERKAD